MGFELSYTYHEKAEKGYNKEETQSKKKKIGDPFEDVSLERLASEIIKLMARRDIFVTDFQIFELAKKEVAFRETKGGIILKNKKFLFDDDNQITVKEIVEEPPQVSVAGSAPFPVSISTQPHNQGQLRPIKYMIFAPEPQHAAEIKAKALRFRVDQKYPIFQIQPHPTGLGEVYKMIDESGREQLVSDKYFVPEPVLYADRELGFSAQNQKDISLNYGNTVSEPDMPNIRR